jgi:SAM-dependent methyltransferase
MAGTRFTDAARVWDERFRQEGFLFGTEPNAYLAGHRALFARGGRALCVADGEGRNSVWLARQGLQVDAFDLSPVAVAKARALAAREGQAVNFHVEGCDTWPWQPHVYDYVVAIFVQFAAPDMRARLFADMVDTLKPGGFLVLQGYTPKQLEYRTGGPPCIEHLYTEDMLRSAFEGLKIVELRAYEAEIQEGKGHHGRSALIGMVAEKI